MDADERVWRYKKADADPTGTTPTPGEYTVRVKQ
jgi:hypothetical protein